MINGFHVGWEIMVGCAVIFIVYSVVKFCGGVDSFCERMFCHCPKAFGMLLFFLSLILMYEQGAEGNYVGGAIYFFALGYLFLMRLFDIEKVTKKKLVAEINNKHNSQENENVDKHTPRPLFLDDYDRCLQIATIAHSGQKRRGGEDYITHPKRVADAFGDLFMKCIAILHDVIEDTNETYDSLIAKGVPESVVKRVDILSKKDGVSYKRYLNEIKKDRFCMGVKVADIVDNLSSDPTPKQIKKYREALWELLG